MFAQPSAPFQNDFPVTAAAGAAGGGGFGAGTRSIQYEHVLCCSSLFGTHNVSKCSSFPWGLVPRSFSITSFLPWSMIHSGVICHRHRSAITPNYIEPNRIQNVCRYLRIAETIQSLWNWRGFPPQLLVCGEGASPESVWPHYPLTNVSQS